MASYLGARVIFSISITICEIFTVETCMTLTMTFRMGRQYISLHFVIALFDDKAMIVNRLANISVLFYVVQFRMRPI